MKQVITIGADGSMSGLQRKPGQGIDLRSFGHAEIERASLVEWDADHQAWYINVLQENGKGIIAIRDLALANFSREQVDALAPSFRNDLAPMWEDPAFFDEYDDAVKVEIAYLDALRLKGQF